MKKKPNQKYTVTRERYKAAKSYDHQQFNEFCSNIYTEGFKDGEKSVKGVDVSVVMAAIKTVKGIGEKRLAQIESAISAVMEPSESGEADERR